MENNSIPSGFYVFKTTEDTEVWLAPNYTEERVMVGWDLLTGRVIGCAIEVHKALGPGLLESTYHRCLNHELKLNGIGFESEYPMSVNYKGIQLDCGYRVDVLVDGKLILELKAVEQITGVHKAQLLTYMKLAAIDTGLLINFNVQKLKDGIQRFKL